MRLVRDQMCRFGEGGSASATSVLLYWLTHIISLRFGRRTAFIGQIPRWTSHTLIPETKILHLWRHAGSEAGLHGTLIEPALVNRVGVEVWRAGCRLVEVELFHEA